jgi:DNA invertase Pin-like site-specific DNA recombinase
MAPADIAGLGTPLAEQLAISDQLAAALASVRAGDTLVVPELDRLARSVPDARAIGDG